MLLDPSDPKSIIAIVRGGMHTAILDTLKEVGGANLVRILDNQLDTFINIFNGHLPYASH